MSGTRIKLDTHRPTEPVGTATVTLFPLVVVPVSPRSSLFFYTTVFRSVAFAPVKVMLGDELFLHTVVVPEIVAVGNGFTVTVALPVWV